MSCRLRLFAVLSQALSCASRYQGPNSMPASPMLMCHASGGSMHNNRHSLGGDVTRALLLPDEVKNDACDEQSECVLYHQPSKRKITVIHPTAAVVKVRAILHSGRGMAGWQESVPVGLVITFSMLCCFPSASKLVARIRSRINMADNLEG